MFTGMNSEEQAFLKNLANEKVAMQGELQLLQQTILQMQQKATAEEAGKRSWGKGVWG